MTDSPTIDGRGREEMLADLRERADDYTTAWDPTTEDAGTTLMLLFSRFGMDVLSRLNDVPHKHRVAFLDALDFDRRPPQSARAPLTFTTTADIDENVVVGGGTQVTAEAADGETVIFEIPSDEGFEATAATLASAYSVDPESNSIYRHASLVDGGGGTRIFTGTDRQSHELYLGHSELLNLEAGSTVTLAMQTDSDATLDERVTWEYFGENDDGDVGWHLLPRKTPDIVEDPFGDEVALEEKMQRVSERVEQLGESSAADAEGLYSPTFQFPGPTAERAVAGAESRWIRARIPGSEPSDFGVEVDSVRLDVDGGTAEDTRRPTRVFSNDVPLSVGDGDFRPFGRMPQPPTTLYLASEEAFTKHGGTVTIQFAPSTTAEEAADADEDSEEGQRLTASLGGTLAGPPEISWEYWNGNGWTQLGLATDKTDAFQSAGEISFTVPDDFGTTSVSGHDDYWVRARLVSGNYGQPEYRVTEDGRRSELVQRPDPPVFGDITVSYGQEDAGFEHVVTHNNASYSEESTDDTVAARHDEPLRPFAPLPEETQTLYLGFDATLREGPINLHIPMQDKAYPRGFEPALRWEYCVDPASNTWEKLDVYDGTEGLTERGIVSISFPSPTEPLELFGEGRHWIRATVTRAAFVTTADSAAAGESQAATQAETDAPGAGDSTPPPTLTGINPNTQWAYNERTVEERLGGSDGAPAQTFRCSHAPITDAAVWVDESGSLSEAEQRDLLDRRPDDVRRTERSGDTDEFWVRWAEVPDFLSSTATDRHYRLDRTNGQVTFGDGQAGAIPPTGEQNVEAVYGAGGGSDGNVDAGAVTDLRSSISRIDAVTNLKPSDGGTDVESLSEAVERAPEQIKNRGRAVAPADFEQIAMESSRQLAHVKCEPEMDEAGDRSPGWVTLLIIPRERRRRPTPSLELRQRVRDAVSERAPATLVGGDSKRIVVRGPDYAEVSIETTVATKGVESITNLKATIETQLEEFFHPLTGGRDGEGWAFGEAPRLSRLTTLVEATEGVDRVRDIGMTIETTTEEKIIRDPTKEPALARDEMISSGAHEVNIIMRGTR